MRNLFLSITFKLYFSWKASLLPGRKKMKHWRLRESLVQSIEFLRVFHWKTKTKLISSSRNQERKMFSLFAVQRRQVQGWKHCKTSAQGWKHLRCHLSKQSQLCPWKPFWIWSVRRKQKKYKLLREREREKWENRLCYYSIIIFA